MGLSLFPWQIESTITTLQFFPNFLCLSHSYEGTFKCSRGTDEKVIWPLVTIALSLISVHAYACLDQMIVAPERSLEEADFAKIKIPFPQLVPQEAPPILFHYQPERGCSIL